MTYAADTSVPVERSRNEIEKILARYGASAFGYMTDDGQAVVMFEAHGRRIRFQLTLPKQDERRFTHTKTGTQRTDNAAFGAWEQGCRARWRALVLCIKAKLESVESQITDFESEFLAWIMLPTGETMGEVARPAIDHAYSTGTMPALMAGAK